MLDFDELLQTRESSVSEIYRRNTLTEARFEDFHLMHVIGKGTFGKVYLVRCIKNDRLFAMKCIRKDVVIEHESVESLKVERLILTQVNHPFVIGMDYVFQKAYRVYFIMEFIQGGELFKHLSEAKRFDEAKTKFYAAQIALALGYLHESKIIYRDLKPENILLDNNGYIKLADFGLAKIVNDEKEEEPNSFCGTPEYLSPEMILGSGHDNTLDWWALGILIYEMIIGIPPFYNNNKNQMYFLIQNAPIRWPD
jgi:serum/glucocorticoid-regulated kinase 2